MGSGHGQESALVPKTEANERHKDGLVAAGMSHKSQRGSDQQREKLSRRSMST